MYSNLLAICWHSFSLVRKSVKERVAVVNYADSYNVSDVSRAISELKKNKFPGADMLCSEHLIYASNKLHVVLIMFNTAIMYGHLHDSSRKLIIVLIAK